jgi:hypothetical protein
MTEGGSKHKKLPRKTFLIVDEDDFPSVFSSEVLASSNRKLKTAKHS